MIDINLSNIFKMQKIKTIFLGSGEFAVPILEELLKFPYIDLSVVVTQPDKPAGRKQQLQKVPVAEFLTYLATKPTIYQPGKYRNDEDMILDKEKPELIIVADYGQLLPEKTINYPKYKCLNVHGSLLPDLRGAVPIPLAILKGYSTTGVSIPVMTTGLDDGPIVAIEEMEISPDDTTTTLKNKLAKKGAKLLVQILPMWYSGQIEPTEQNESKATIADKSLIAKENAKFTKSESALQVDRMIRAFNPWPVAWTEIKLQDKQLRLKVYKAKLTKRLDEFETGRFCVNEGELYLQLSDEALHLEELQLEGKQVGSGKDYLYLAGQHGTLN